MQEVPDPSILCWVLWLIYQMPLVQYPTVRRNSFFLVMYSL